MADIKKTAQEMGQKVAETATKVGHKISEGAEKASDWVKEKAHEVGHRAEEMGQKASNVLHSTGTNTTANIKEHMEVISSCGCHIGTVDHVEGSKIKLTRNDPEAGGQHHFIPTSWVDHVDQHVHLNKDAAETRSQWQAEPAGTR